MRKKGFASFLRIFYLTNSVVLGKNCTLYFLHNIGIDGRKTRKLCPPMLTLFLFRFIAPQGRNRGGNEGEGFIFPCSLSSLFRGKASIYGTTQCFFSEVPSSTTLACESPRDSKRKKGWKQHGRKLQKKRVLLQNTQDSLRQIQISISFSAEPQALGQARTAEVRRDARIGEAEARMQVRATCFDSLKNKYVTF